LPLEQTVLGYSDLEAFNLVESGPQVLPVEFEGTRLSTRRTWALLFWPSCHAQSHHDVVVWCGFFPH